MFALALVNVDADPAGATNTGTGGTTGTKGPTSTIAPAVHTPTDPEGRPQRTRRSSDHIVFLCTERTATVHVHRTAAADFRGFRMILSWARVLGPSHRR